MIPDPASIDIFLLDDHSVVREGIRMLLEKEPDFRVVGEGASLAEALSATCDPDVVLSDLLLPDAQGAESISALRTRHPRAAILVLTMIDSPAEVHFALAAGARGFLLKDAAAHELSRAIRTVAAGEEYVQPSLGAALARWNRLSSESRTGVTTQITPREQEVVRLLALGHTNAEIAGLLGVSLRTVEAHRASLSDKLGMRTRAELVRYAVKAGLIDLDRP